MALSDKEIAEMEKELAKLLVKREKLGAVHMQKYRDRAATRSQTTTYNANVSNLNERIVWLRTELKKTNRAAFAPA